MHPRAWRALHPGRFASQYTRPVRIANLPARTRPTPVRSGASFWSITVAVGVSVGAAYIWRASSPAPDDGSRPAPQPSHPAAFESDPLALSLFGMPADVAPGRPGNLTPEQEAKLLEFWIAVLRVFGVYDPTAAEPANGNTTAVDGAKSPASVAKKKRHLFRRRKDPEANSENSSVTGSPAPSVIVDMAGQDDKYGQGKDFQKVMAQQAPSDLRAAFWSMTKHDHPDALLLRFLRARKWDINAALIMMVSTMHWRAQEMHVDDDIVINGEEGELKRSKETSGEGQKDGDGFMQQIRMGKSYLHGVDKEGRPLCFVRVRLHRAGEQSEKSLERFTVFTIETARMLLRPPVDTATIVFDMTDFSMANMDYMPVKFMIKCFEANYPESLGAVLVYKAPWLFSGIWKIIRGWLDPVVAGKVHFCDRVEDLAQFIEKSKVPKEAGGDDPYEYKYVEPREGENRRMKEEEKREALKKTREEMVERYEDSVLRWIGGEFKDAKEALAQRNTIATELRDNYWALDPFVRARTIYDRLGILGDGGKLDFYPQSAPAAVTAPIAVPVAASEETSKTPTSETSFATAQEDVD